MNRLLLPLALALSFPAAEATAQSQAPAPAQATAPAETEREAFQRRLAAGVSRLQSMAGSWSVTFYNKARDGNWAPQAPQTITFRPTMNGLYLEMQLATPGYNYQMVFSYDAAMQTYRMVSRDDVSGLIDVYQGDFNADGALVLTNLQSGTHYVSGGKRIHNRITITPGPNGWSGNTEGSADGGVTWRQQGRSESRRIGNAG